jgi:hypothetical protein
MSLGRIVDIVGGIAPAALIALAVLAGCAPPPSNTTRRWVAQDGDVIEPDGKGGSPGEGFGSGGTGGMSAADRSGGNSGAAGGSSGAAGGSSGAGGFGAGGGFGGFSGQGGSFSNTGGSGAGGYGGQAAPPADPVLANEPFTPTGPPGPCSLAVSVTTIPIGSDYSPSNIGAIWIADSSGKFVKTLAVWANRRMRHLEAWMDATTAAGLPRDTIDAVTSATARSHGTHISTWNCTDAKKAQVPRGAYRVCMEMTEFNGAGPKGCIAFDNGGKAFRLTPPDIGSYKARVFDYKPQ